MLRTEAGGLKAPMSNSTVSVLLEFPDDVSLSGIARVGAIIDVLGGEPLRPGRAETPAKLTVLAPENARYLGLGTRFGL